MKNTFARSRISTPPGGPSAERAGRVFGCRSRIERDGSSGAGGTSAKPRPLCGPRTRPACGCIRFAARGPIPLAGVFASRPEDPSRSLPDETEKWRLGGSVNARGAFGLSWPSDATFAACRAGPPPRGLLAPRAPSASLSLKHRASQLLLESTRVRMASASLPPMSRNTCCTCLLASRKAATSAGVRGGSRVR